jgi:hypothetical protein
MLGATVQAHPRTDEEQELIDTFRKCLDAWVEAAVARDSSFFDRCPTDPNFVSWEPEYCAPVTYGEGLGSGRMWFPWACLGWRKQLLDDAFAFGS